MRKTRLNRARLQPQAVRVASAALGIVLAMMLAPPEAAARNVPTAPLNLMADPITSTHIYVTWDLPATTNGTRTHYIIEYRDPSTWSELVDTSRQAMPLRASRKWDEESVPRGGTRSYRVKAVNSPETGPVSNVANRNRDVPGVQVALGERRPAHCPARHEQPDRPESKENPTMKIRILTALALAGALAACSDEASSTTAPLAPSPVGETTAEVSDSSRIKPTPPPDVAGTDGMVRNATRSDATIAKPVIIELSRISDSEIAVRWGVTSVSNINDYRIQWAPGCVTGWNRRTGAASLFYESGGRLVELTSFIPYGNWSALHSAFKVRIRARMAADTLTHRKGGPWSDTTLLYPQNTTSDGQGCSVGFRTTSADFCVTVINGVHSEFEVTADHTAKLDAGTGTTIADVAHAASESIGHGRFRAEARTTPTGWEIVTIDQEWRDYC